VTAVSCGSSRRGDPGARHSFGAEGVYRQAHALAPRVGFRGWGGGRQRQLATLIDPRPHRLKEIQPFTPDRGGSCSHSRPMITLATLSR